MWPGNKLPSIPYSFFSISMLALLLQGCFLIRQIKGNIVTENNAQEAAIASWKESLPLEFNSSDSFQASYPQLALSNNGQAIIAWPQHDGESYQIFISHFDGTTWNHPEGLVDSISLKGSNSQNISVSINDTGKILITWKQEILSDDHVYFSYFNGTNWDHPTTLTDKISLSGSDATNPQAYINNSGKMIITWSQNDGSEDQVYYS